MSLSCSKMYSLYARIDKAPILNIYNWISISRIIIEEKKQEKALKKKIVKGHSKSERTNYLGNPEIQRLKLGATVFNIKMSHCTKFQISSNLATVGVKTQNLQRFDME